MTTAEYCRFTRWVWDVTHSIPVNGSLDISTVKGLKNVSLFIKVIKWDMDANLMNDFYFNNDYSKLYRTPKIMKENEAR